MTVTHGASSSDPRATSRDPPGERIVREEHPGEDTVDDNRPVAGAVLRRTHNGQLGGRARRHAISITDAARVSRRRWSPFFFTNAIIASETGGST